MQFHISIYVVFVPKLKGGSHCIAKISFLVGMQCINLSYFDTDVVMFFILKLTLILWLPSFVIYLSGLQWILISAFMKDFWSYHYHDQGQALTIDKLGDITREAQKLSIPLLAKAYLVLFSLTSGFNKKIISLPLWFIQSMCIRRARLIQ